MKQLHIIFLALAFILAGSISSHAQKTYTIHVGNARLSILLDSLNENNKLIAQRDQADSVFTQAVAYKIDSIKERVEERKFFIAALKRVNATTLPSKFCKLEYESLNNRLALEAKPLATDYEYARILESILESAPNFRKNKKAYYAEGKYEIPTKIKPLAKKVYAPIIDDIVRLGNKFENTAFQVVIKSMGYADGSYIPRSGTLYKDMAVKLQTNDLSDNEMHTYLSYLRAYDASAILNELFYNKRDNLINPNNMNVAFENIGKGNELPPNTAQDAPMNKRRVVYIDWYILPKF